jgi:hypothetical protein
MFVLNLPHCIKAIVFFFFFTGVKTSIYESSHAPLIPLPISLLTREGISHLPKTLMATTTVFKSFWKLWSLFARESRIDLKEIQSQQWAAGRSWELPIPYMKKNMNILLPPLLSLYLIFLLLQHPSALE